jgi:hypothetical protein
MNHIRITRMLEGAEGNFVRSQIEKGNSDYFNAPEILTHRQNFAGVRAPVKANHPAFMACFNDFDAGLLKRPFHAADAGPEMVY